MLMLLQYMARVEHAQDRPVVDISVRLRAEVVADLIRFLSFEFRTEVPQSAGQCVPVDARGPI